MVSGLKKAIENYILPQYPWIVDYEVELGKGMDDKMELIKVLYYHEIDDNGDIWETPLFNKVRWETISVFNMMNDGEHILNNVRFITTK
jgi:hypothetical protein